MSIWIAIMLWAWVPDGDALRVYTRFFSAVYAVDCDEALGAAWIEGKHRRNPTSKVRPTPWSPETPWKICGAYQLTGGRYGRPECVLMIAWLWVGVWAGVRAVDYWQGRCKPRWYCGYNEGNAGCDADCGGHVLVKYLARTKPWLE